MSSKAGKLTKQLKSHSYFEPSMYRTYPGSVLICYCMFEKADEPTKARIKKQWKKVVKSPENYYSEENIFDIDFTLQLFGLTRTYKWPVAVFRTSVNTLLAPYTTNPEDETEIAALPLRENGFMDATLTHPETCFIVEWK